MSKIGIIGDCHFKPRLAYADYISDGRENERKEILDFIVAKFADCDGIVFMGDNFDKASNSAEVIRMFTEFVERFNGKKVYILAGNHEKTANGKSAVDYLREIKNPNWFIITDGVQIHDNLLGFVPYFFRQEIKVDTFEKGKDWIMSGLRHIQEKGIKFLFVHHAISDTLTVTGQNTSLFPEIVLPKTELEEMFDLIIGGHIHKPQRQGKTIVTGCVFNNEIGDEDKNIWILDTDNSDIKSILLPGRPLVKRENPNIGTLELIPKNAIVKIVLSDPILKASEYQEHLKRTLKRFDAYILLEQYPNSRQQLDINEGIVEEFTIEYLLKLYSKTRKLDYNKLISAWELVK